VIRGVKLSNSAQGLLIGGKYPLEILPTMMHEMVHHWCFRSAVGTALSYLQLRARRLAMQLTKHGVEEQPMLSRHFFRDLMLYETTLMVMRPLAEGLALFAEFDAYVGDAKSISTVMSIAYMVCFEYLSKSPEERYPSYEQLNSLLFGQRLERRGVEQKANLLVHPFSCADGGYLPGYLLIKNVLFWLLAKQNCSSFNDSDLFLSYTRSFFYDDYRLVALLLANYDSWDEARDAIGLHCQERLAQLLRTEEHDVAAFDHARSQDSFFKGRPNESDSEIESFMPTPGPQQSAEDIQIGRRRLASALKQQLSAEVSDETENALNKHQLWVLAARQILAVARCEERIEFNQHGRIQVGEVGKFGDRVIPQLSFSSDRPHEPFVGTGELVVFVAPTFMYRFMAIIYQGEVISVNYFPPRIPPEDLQQEFRKYVEAYELDASIRQAWTDTIHSVAFSRGYWELLALQREQAVDFANRHYLPKTLFQTPDKYVQNVLATMKDTGFYQILGEDADLIRSAAYLSLANGAVWDIDRLFRLLDNQGISGQNLSRQLEQSGVEHHCPLIRRTQSSLLSFV
jgi:hypothetical protein